MDKQLKKQLEAITEALFDVALNIERRVLIEEARYIAEEHREGRVSDKVLEEARKNALQYMPIRSIGPEDGKTDKPTES